MLDRGLALILFALPLLRAGEPSSEQVAGLGAPDAAARRSAEQTLIAQGEKAAPAVLAALAEVQDEEVRLGCVHMLGMLPAARARSLPVLRGLLGDPAWRVRSRACLALGRLRALDEASLSALAEALADPCRSVGRAAVWALTESGASAVPHLAQAAGHRDPRARSWALRALELMKPDARSVTEAIVHAADDPAYAIARRAVLAGRAAGLDPAAFGDRLAAWYGGEDDSHRMIAAWLLDRLLLSPEERTDLVLKTLTQGPLESRIVAIRAAADTLPASERLTAALAGIFAREGDPLRREAALALASLSGEAFPVAEAVVAAVEVTEREPRVRAYRLLARRPALAAKALPALIRQLGREEDIGAVGDLFGVLRSLGASAAEALPAVLARAGSPDADLRIACLECCLALGMAPIQARARFAELLADRDAAVRCRGAAAFARYGAADEAVVAIVRESLADVDAPSYAAAAGAAGCLGAAGVGLVKDLERGLDHRSPAIRLIGAGALLRLVAGHERASALLGAALDEADGRQRIHAVRLLGEAGANASPFLERLRPLAAAADPRLHAAAATAIAAIAGTPP